MKSISALILLSLLYFAEESFAAQTYVCEPPTGTRIDFFVRNQLNLQNNTFLMAKDRVSGMQPKLVIDDALKNVSFIIGDAAELKSLPKTGNMQVWMFTEQQISFTGIVSGAPIMGTFYPKMNVLIYSQQSVWPGPNYEGVRAVMFYSRCQPQA